MSSKSAKSIWFVCLLLSLLLSIFGCLTASSVPDPNRLSIKDLVITMNANHLGDFRAQLRKFADKHSLRFTESFYNKDQTFFSVQMNGHDFHMFIQNAKDSPGEIDFSFFNEATPPIPQRTVDELTIDLKSFIMEIPNVAIAEREKALIITIDENRDQEVLDQLQKFADKHSLEFKLSLSSGKTPYDFDPAIYGDGFHIIGGYRTQAAYMIFYTDINNKTPNPTSIPQETLDELFNDLKKFLDEIPDATVVETY
jgi:hypothetical protein